MTPTCRHIAGAALIASAFLAARVLTEVPAHGISGVLACGVLMFGTLCSLIAGSALLLAHSAPTPARTRRRR